MKIKSLHIQNFKSVQETTIFLNPTLSVLTGINNSGKTTVLEALALWSECFEKLVHQAKASVSGKYSAGDYVFGSASNYFDFTEINSVKLSWFEDIFYNRDVSLTILLEARLENERGDKLTLPFTIRNSSKSRYNIVLKDEGAFDYAKFKSFFTKFPVPVKSYFAVPLANIEKQETFMTDPLIQNSMNQRRSFEILRNRLYKLYHSGAPFAQFQQDLSYVLYGNPLVAVLKFYSESDVQHDVRVVINYTIDNETVRKDIALLGSGCLQAIEILLDLYNRVYGQCDLNLILLDEPDSHIHRVIQKRLYEVLTKFNGGNQIVITTHNESMIRTVSLSNLFHVDVSRKELRSINSAELDKIGLPHFVGMYPAQETPLIRSVSGNSIGLDLISAIEADRIFFVEGDDDARTLFRLYRQKPANADKKVMFWVMGGISNVISKIEGYRDVFTAVRNGKSLWDKSSLIFDQDYMMDRHLQNLNAFLGSHNIKSHVSNMYTMESVLLTDLHKLSILLCRHYGFMEDMMDALAAALQCGYSDAESLLRHSVCNDDNGKRFVQEYAGQYLNKLGIRKSDEENLLFIELKKYYESQPLYKLAKKEHVESVINNALEQIGHSPEFNIETDFYELVKLADYGTRFDNWNELIRFMSE